MTKVPDDDLPDNLVPADDLPEAVKPSLLKAGLTSGLDAVKNTLGAAIEPGLNLASSMLAKPISDIAGLAAAGKEMIAPGGGNPTQFKNDIQNAMTYQPRTEAGKLGSEYNPLALIGKGVGAVAQGTGNLIRGNAAGDTPQGMIGNAVQEALPTALPLGAGKLVSKLPMKVDTRAQSRNSIKDETWSMAKEEGYVLPPSAIKPTFIGNRLEGVGGKAALGQESALRNQEVTNKIAREESGLKPDDPISTQTLENARQGMYKAYEETAQLSPLAKTSLEKLQEARAESKAYWAHYNSSLEPNSLRQAKVWDNKASMYESVIDRIAKSKGAPDLLERLRQSRKDLAKNYTVDNALNLGSGDIDAQVIGRQLDKGKPLSDGLEKIGRFAQAFPSYARDVARVPAPGVSKLEGFGAASLGIGGKAAGLGWLPAGLPFLSGPARSLALSKMMQSQRQYGPGTLANMLQAQANPAVTAGEIGYGNKSLADLLNGQ